MLTVLGSIISAKTDAAIAVDIACVFLINIWSSSVSVTLLNAF
jgi:hypothetical protein